MTTSIQYRTHISGTGSYLPEKTLSNKDLELMVDTNDEWIRERTGIETRHVAAPEQATSDLCLIAANRALEDSGIPKEEIDMIIVATVSGDYQLPSTACLLQDKLGLKGIPAFDLAAACSGFVYALSVADQFIRSGMHKKILVVGAEVITRFVNYKDRETCILFGDGAGAMVVTRAEPNAKDIILSSHLHAEGSLYELFVLPAGGSRLPSTHETLDQGLNSLKMKGREIFKNAVRTMSGACAEALEANKMTMDEVDWLVPHQANFRIMEAVATHFKFPQSKVISIVNEMGNTSAATIPVAFDMARKQGKIKRGQNILLTAFGAGLTSGSLVLKF